MKKAASGLCLQLLLLGMAAHPAGAETFRFASQSDYKTLDPYTLNETFGNALHNAVYEGLVRRGPDLKIEPALAESWEIAEPTRWRFHLRHGVKFHEGQAFTADDVLFSVERARQPGSNATTRVAADAKFVKVDDYTVDVVLNTPNPSLIAEWESFFIMSKSWAEENGATLPTPASATSPGYASLHSNGTGPFYVDSYQPGVRTTWKPNASWWGKPEFNIDAAVFTPISSGPTRVAALLSGEVDWIDPVPLQDIPRVESTDGVSVMAGPELRTMFFGLDQRRDELRYSSVKGKNPFKDARVRKAFYQAIDIEGIMRGVMRRKAIATALPISPVLFSRAAEFKRFPFDIEAAKKLMAEAGYPDGFKVTLDCPNDRYVNDEAICQAVAAMLSKINVEVTLNSMPAAKYGAKVSSSGGFDTSFYFVGWTPATFDSWNVLYNLFACRNDQGRGAGEINWGGYCNPRVDELIGMISKENDTKKRDDYIAEAYRTVMEKDIGILPMHQQSLSWGVSRKFKIVQRPDNYPLLQWVNSVK